MSRQLIVVALCVMIVCTHLAKEAEAREISYGALNHGRTPCNPGNEANCRKDRSVNRYRRGCEVEEGCRDGNRRRREDKDNDDDDEKDDKN